MLSFPTELEKKKTTIVRKLCYDFITTFIELKSVSDAQISLLRINSGRIKYKFEISINVNFIIALKCYNKDYIFNLKWLSLKPLMHTTLNS